MDHRGKGDGGGGKVEVNTMTAPRTVSGVPNMVGRLRRPTGTKPTTGGNDEGLQRDNGESSSGKKHTENRVDPKMQIKREV